MVVRCRIVVVAKQTSRRREDGVVMVSATERMMERKWRCCVAVVLQFPASFSGGRRGWRRRLPWRVEGKLGLGFHV